MLWALFTVEFIRYSETKRLVDGVKVGMFDTIITVDDLFPMKLTQAELLIGNSFLRTFIVQIDYPNRRMRLLDRRGGVLVRMFTGALLSVVPAMLMATASTI